jgi:hypothetical protein
MCGTTSPALASAPAPALTKTVRSSHITQYPQAPVKAPEAGSGRTCGARAVDQGLTLSMPSVAQSSSLLASASALAAASASGPSSRGLLWSMVLQRSMLRSNMFVCPCRKMLLHELTSTNSGACRMRGALTAERAPSGDGDAVAGSRGQPCTCPECWLW